MPPYQALLDAYHAAWEKELRQIVQALPFSPAAHVLDVGCGTGFYTRLMAERLSMAGSITGVDSSQECLKTAIEESRSSAVPIHYIEGHIQRLPFHDDLFDFTWCAQSLYSFPDPLSALREMARVTRPGGLVSVLENDSLHEFILPFPPAVELAFRTAEFRAFKANNSRVGKFYIGRNLRKVFEQAGLAPHRLRTITTDRSAPLYAAAQDFFAEYLKNLAERIEPYLEEDFKGSLSLLDPQSPDYLLNDPHFTATRIDRVLWGKKSVADASA